MFARMFACFASAFAMVIFLTIQSLASTNTNQVSSVDHRFDRPLYFTENKGQWDERVLFKADGAGALTWFIERDGFTVLFSVPDTTAEPLTDPRSMGMPDEMRRFDAVDSYPNKAHALKFKLQNALPRSAGNFLPEQSSPASASSIESIERLSWNNNYFLGNDESKWAPDCGNYQRVVLKDVWSGIDVQWRGVGKAVEFDFVIAPGADANQIRVEVLGLMGELSLNTGDTESAELSLGTSLGTLRMALPETFQIDEDGSLREVGAEFKVEGGNAFGVALPEGHDPNKPLVVDPLVYSTFIGAHSLDYPYGLAIDGAGGIVVAGYTTSDDFPTTEGAINRERDGNRDAFVARLSANGGELLSSTFLGGENDEEACNIILDEDGAVVVAGYTGSNDFPTTEGAYDRSYNGGFIDAFIARLNIDGNQLLGGTYLGGADDDNAQALSLDGAGAVVVAGNTTSDDFPTTEGVLSRSLTGRCDGFIARLSMNEGELICSSYLGGDSAEVIHDILPDNGEGLIVVGTTGSDDFPATERAFDRSYNGGITDGFIVHSNWNLNELIFATYIGGSGNDFANTLALDQSGEIVVAGWTISEDFPTTDGAFDRSPNGNYDAFVIRMSEDGSELTYGTYIGGSIWDSAIDVVVDSAGIIVAGWTSSQDFPTTEGAFDLFMSGGQDIFVTRLYGDGSALFYSTFFGGNSSEYVGALVSDGVGGVVIVGGTRSPDFPVTIGAFDTSYNRSEDVYVTHLSDLSLRWREIPTLVEGIENNMLVFEILGESASQNEVLTIEYQSANIPNDVARFNDNRDGSGSFEWDTGYDESGEYTATFTLSDGTYHIDANVVIVIHNLNRVPSSLLLVAPSDHTPISSDSMIHFAWNPAIDEDGEELAYHLKIIGQHDTLKYDAGVDTSFDVEKNTVLALLASDSLSWEVWAMDGEDSTRCRDQFVLFPPLDIRETPLTPYTLHLSPFPNPFNSAVRLTYSLPKSGRVGIGIFDITGREIARLVDGSQAAGVHFIDWQADACPTGVYFVWLECNGENQWTKMTLLK